MLFQLPKLDLFPTSPGVYLMKNKQGNVLYIGKAKNIRSRVRQYFSFTDTREMIPHLISQVSDVETIIVFSEKEALLLENNLIKQHRPKYNILLKDDKSYIALKVTKSKWPRVDLVRYKGKPKADGIYFGPYTSAFAARQTLDIIQKIFPLRQCSDQEFLRRTRPCILYDMKRCIAPCVNKCTKEEYDHLVDRAIKFLKGQDTDVIKDLYSQMHTYSEQLEFEKAAEILKIIRQIETTLEGQNVDKPLGIDMDALAIFRQADEVVLSKLIFRNGKLINSSQFHFDKVVEDDKELFSSFLLQHYLENSDFPHEILLSAAIEDDDALSEILSENKKRTVKIFMPQKGEKLKLVQMAFANAESAFKQEKDIHAIKEKTLEEMKEKFLLKSYPKRIECFDNSHTGGTLQVSSLVTFTDGFKDTKRYRRYKLKNASESDDYANMYEVLSRRFKRAKEEEDLPDLLIVDGGKGQLNIALKVLHELEIVTLDVISVAKEKSRHDKGMTEEQVFLPNMKDPILLKPNSKVLFLLQQIRDEAHRFAITYHKKLRSKNFIKSALDDIPGIGTKKRELLLRYFGSIKKLKEANYDELKKVKGLSSKDIQTLLETICKK